jgi:hypothetical protein
MTRGLVRRRLFLAPYFTICSQRDRFPLAEELLWLLYSWWALFVTRLEAAFLRHAVTRVQCPGLYIETYIRVVLCQLQNPEHSIRSCWELLFCQKQMGVACYLCTDWKKMRYIEGQCSFSSCACKSTWRVLINVWCWRSTQKIGEGVYLIRVGPVYPLLCMKFDSKRIKSMTHWLSSSCNIQSESWHVSLPLLTAWPQVQPQGSPYAVFLSVIFSLTLFIHIDSWLSTVCSSDIGCGAELIKSVNFGVLCVSSSRRCYVNVCPPINTGYVLSVPECSQVVISRSVGRHLRT